MADNALAVQGILSFQRLGLEALADTAFAALHQNGIIGVGDGRGGHLQQWRRVFSRFSSLPQEVRENLVRRQPRSLQSEDLLGEDCHDAPETFGTQSGGGGEYDDDDDNEDDSEDDNSSTNAIWGEAYTIHQRLLRLFALCASSFSSTKTMCCDGSLGFLCAIEEACHDLLACVQKQRYSALCDASLRAHKPSFVHARAWRRGTIADYAPRRSVLAYRSSSDSDSKRVGGIITSMFEEMARTFFRRLAVYAHQYLQPDMNSNFSPAKVYHIRFSSGTGGSFLTAGDDGLIKVWDTETCQLCYTIKRHFLDIIDVDICWNDRLAVSCCSMKQLKLWRLGPRSWKPEGSVSKLSSWLTFSRFLPKLENGPRMFTSAYTNDCFLITTCDDGHVRVYLVRSEAADREDAGTSVAMAVREPLLEASTSMEMFLGPQYELIYSARSLSSRVLTLVAVLSLGQFVPRTFDMFGRAVYLDPGDREERDGVEAKWAVCAAMGLQYEGVCQSQMSSRSLRLLVCRIVITYKLDTQGFPSPCTRLSVSIEPLIFAVPSVVSSTKIPDVTFSSLSPTRLVTGSDNGQVLIWRPFCSEARALRTLVEEKRELNEYRSYQHPLAVRAAAEAGVAGTALITHITSLCWADNDRVMVVGSSIARQTDKNEYHEKTLTRETEISFFEVDTGRRLLSIADRKRIKSNVSFIRRHPTVASLLLVGTYSGQVLLVNAALDDLFLFLSFCKIDASEVPMGQTTSVERASCDDASALAGMSDSNVPASASSIEVLEKTTTTTSGKTDVKTVVLGGLTVNTRWRAVEDIASAVPGDSASPGSFCPTLVYRFLTYPKVCFLDGQWVPTGDRFVVLQGDGSFSVFTANGCNTLDEVLRLNDTYRRTPVEQFFDGDFREFSMEPESLRVFCPYSNEEPHQLSSGVLVDGRRSPLPFTIKCPAAQFGRESDPAGGRVVQENDAGFLCRAVTRWTSAVTDLTEAYNRGRLDEFGNVAMSIGYVSPFARRRTATGAVGRAELVEAAERSGSALPFPPELVAAESSSSLASAEDDESSNTSSDATVVTSDNEVDGESVTVSERGRGAGAALVDRSSAARAGALRDRGRRGQATPSRQPLRRRRRRPDEATRSRLSSLPEDRDPAQTARGTTPRFIGFEGDASPASVTASRSEEPRGVGHAVRRTAEPALASFAYQEESRRSRALSRRTVAERPTVDDVSLQREEPEVGRRVATRAISRRKRTRDRPQEHSSSSSPSLSAEDRYRRRPRRRRVWEAEGSLQRQLRQHLHRVSLESNDRAFSDALERGETRRSTGSSPSGTHDTAGPSSRTSCARLETADRSTTENRAFLSALELTVLSLSENLMGTPDAGDDANEAMSFLRRATSFLALFPRNDLCDNGLQAVQLQPARAPLLTLRQLLGLAVRYSHCCDAVREPSEAFRALLQRFPYWILDELQKTGWAQQGDSSLLSLKPCLVCRLNGCPLSDCPINPLMLHVFLKITASCLPEVESDLSRQSLDSLLGLGLSRLYALVARLDAATPAVPQSSRRSTATGSKRPAPAARRSSRLPERSGFSATASAGINGRDLDARESLTDIWYKKEEEQPSSESLFTALHRIMAYPGDSGVHLAELLLHSDRTEAVVDSPYMGKTEDSAISSSSKRSLRGKRDNVADNEATNVPFSLFDFAVRGLADRSNAPRLCGPFHHTPWTRSFCSPNELTSEYFWLHPECFHALFSYRGDPDDDSVLMITRPSAEARQRPSRRAKTRGRGCRSEDSDFAWSDPASLVLECSHCNCVGAVESCTQCGSSFHWQCAKEVWDAAEETRQRNNARGGRLRREFPDVLTWGYFVCPKPQCVSALRSAAPYMTRTVFTSAQGIASRQWLLADRRSLGDYVPQLGDVVRFFPSEFLASPVASDPYFPILESVFLAGMPADAVVVDIQYKFPSYQAVVSARGGHDRSNRGWGCPEFHIIAVLSLLILLPHPNAGRVFSFPCLPVGPQPFVLLSEVWRGLQHAAEINEQQKQFLFIDDAFYEGTVVQLRPIEHDVYTSVLRSTKCSGTLEFPSVSKRLIPLLEWSDAVGPWLSQLHSRLRGQRTTTLQEWSAAIADQKYYDGLAIVGMAWHLPAPNRDIPVSGDLASHTSSGFLATAGSSGSSTCNGKRSGPRRNIPSASSSRSVDNEIPARTRHPSSSDDDDDDDDANVKFYNCWEVFEEPSQSGAGGTERLSSTQADWFRQAITAATAGTDLSSSSSITEPRMTLRNRTVSVRNDNRVAKIPREDYAVFTRPIPEPFPSNVQQGYTDGDGLAESTLWVDEYWMEIPLPSSLDLIRRRLDTGYYRSDLGVLFDLQLLYRNSVQFNGADDVTTEAAQHLLSCVARNLVYCGTHHHDNLTPLKR